MFWRNRVRADPAGDLGRDQCGSITSSERLMRGWELHEQLRLTAVRKQPLGMNRSSAEGRGRGCHRDAIDVFNRAARFRNLSLAQVSSPIRVRLAVLAIVPGRSLRLPRFPRRELRSEGERGPSVQVSMLSWSVSLFSYERSGWKGARNVRDSMVEAEVLTSPLIDASRLECTRDDPPGMVPIR